ncbi:MAG: SET domain-containing protein-lysine N-methyltransferase [Betaproteobacteria bacterium]|nr:SET domain-containing protein-lysine N-methyltransferase [Betaproteobacteria bacterium]
MPAFRNQAHKLKTTNTRSGPRIVTRNSSIHGRGVFARLPLAKGARVIEYAGERISDKECERRYPEYLDEDNHTFIFELAENVNIDGGSKGNSARWINHSCAPNCETIEEDDKIYVVAIRRIRAGEELTYDYNMDAGEPLTPAVKKRWPCRCGAEKCRGTVLKPTRKRKKKKSKRR